MKRTTLAKVFILLASVMVRSIFTAKRSVTARACQAGDSSPTSDCQISGLAEAGGSPRRWRRLAQLPDGSAGVFVELLAPLPVPGDRRVGVVPAARAGSSRRLTASSMLGVVRRASVVHSCFLAGDVPMPRAHLGHRHGAGS